MTDIEQREPVARLEDQVKRLQKALAYWLPSVTPEIEIETNGRCGDDALLLVGYEGEGEPDYWSSKAKACPRSDLVLHLSGLCEGMRVEKRGNDVMLFSKGGSCLVLAQLPTSEEAFERVLHFEELAYYGAEAKRS